MSNPNIESKAAGSNVPFVYDWRDELAQFGDTVISESHWTVDKGTITIGADGRASFIAGTLTGCYVQGGTPGQLAVLNNSVLFNTLVDPDSGNKLVRRFTLRITDGAYEPGTPPVVILPDGIPTLVELTAFRGATPGVSVWVDTTTAYPDGTIYYAVPNSSPLVPDGSNVVQGQLIKWVELHYGDGSSGVPAARTISTTSPLAGGGDLSANRTLSIPAASPTANGYMPSTVMSWLADVAASTFITGNNETGHLPLALQLQVNGIGNSQLVMTASSPTITIDAPFGTDEFTYARGDTLAQTTKSVDARTGTNDGTFEFTHREAFWSANSVNKDIVITEAIWLGVGATDTTIYGHVAVVEVEISGVTHAGTHYRIIRQGLLNKGSPGDHNSWGIAQGLSENTAHRIPTTFDPATDGVCLVSMALSGTHNGTITFTFTPTGSGDSGGGFITKIRIFGGGRYA